MNGKEFLSKFKSSFLWANLLAMVLVVVVCVMGIKYGLDTYTHHGEAISIPDVRRRTFDDAEIYSTASALMLWLLIRAM